MSIARLSRDRKRQLGQFFTPPATATAIVRDLTILPAYRILEPSFGNGSFVFAIVDALTKVIRSTEIQTWRRDHLYGCEVDDVAFARFSEKWDKAGLGPLPPHMEHSDFFRWMPPGSDRSAATNRQRYFASRLEMFDLIIGNPPFGGSIDPSIQDELDDIFGVRNSRKIKKETYAFFIVKCVDLLKPGGKLVFICSDTILTIPTMTGLRSWLQETCLVDVSVVPGSFADTNQDMLLLSLTKRANEPRRVSIFGVDMSLIEIESTPNVSWRVNGEYAKYFTGVLVSDKMVATSGMTIGNNELFLRPIQQGAVDEPYEFRFDSQAITVKNAIARARLGKVSQGQLQHIAEQEARGAVEKIVSWQKLDTPRRIALPHSDYCSYNKATSRILYSEPEWVIFWRDNGDYVYTFKKTGNWYLHGVGGMKYFGREGLTWSLIAPRLYARYLPSGYILDSGAPCAFLRPGVPHDELFFIIGWALTDLCTSILKDVLNHTRNIQSKDFERLPYPTWVPPHLKTEAIRHVQVIISLAMSGREFTFKSEEVQSLNELYAWRQEPVQARSCRTLPKQMALF